MVEENSDKRLIDAFQSFSPGLIYTLGPKKEVVQGFLLYRKESVKGLAWTHGDSELAVSFRDSHSHKVRFSLKEDHLFSQCVCGGGYDRVVCRHMLCALMTIKNLLNPALYKQPFQDGRRRESLLTSLMGGQKASPPLHSPNANHETCSASSDVRFAILIEKRGDEAHISVMNNGKKVGLSDPIFRLPPELSSLNNPYDLRNTKESRLLKFLRRHGNTYPVIFRNGKTETEVRWKDTLETEAMTELHVSGNTVHISKRFYMDDQVVSPMAAGPFAFDLKNHVFCVARNLEGWKLWEDIRSACYYANEGMRLSLGNHDDRLSYSLSVPDFQQLKLLIPAELEKLFLESTLFLTDGQETKPELPSTLSHILRIKRLAPPERGYLLEPQFNANGVVRPLSGAIIDLFMALEGERIYGRLKAKKRKEILYRTFFNALAQKTKKAREEVIRDSIEPITFGNYRLMKEGRRILRDYLGETDEKGKRFYLDHGRWWLVPIDRRMESVLYTVPFEVFGAGIFKEMTTHHAMLLKEEDLSKGLPDLYAGLKEKGIELIFDHQPVMTTRWEFELDASRASIDWFEIRPEIRCNGVVIDETLWEKALSGKGMIENNGMIQILDQESLKTLSAIYEVTKNSSGIKNGIVQVPRLQILDWIVLRKSGIKIKLPPEDERIIERLVRFQKIEEMPVPQGLKATLRGYQREGLDWLSFLYENRFGACLADDMGLGKTLQAITLLAWIKERGEGGVNPARACHLLVVPPSLLFNWEREIEKFYPLLKIYLYQGKERTTSFESYDIVLTTYGLVNRDIDKLKEIRFDVIVFDEAQAVKNIHADRTGAVRQLKASFKLALTGTPVENHIGEYFSIMDLVLPGLLGEYKQFTHQVKKENSSFLDTVIRRTKPFILRRTKEEILKELPPKIETDFYLDLTEKQKGLYAKTVEAVRSTIEEAFRTKTTSQAKIIALTGLLKLRQICLTPRLLIPGMAEVTPKIEFLKTQLTKLYTEGHHALVFSQFTSFLNIVEEEIQGNGLRIFRLDGSTPVGNRRKLVEGFQKSQEPSVFLLSLKAGGQGLNLTRATYVFHLDPWWNPAVENQASDRAHRIGQKKKVIITRLIMRHTIEEKMMELKRRKLKLYQAILESPSAGGRLPITKEDFDYLLSAT
jgi:superfamily II DNA or RNA helicase